MFNQLILKDIKNINLIVYFGIAVIFVGLFWVSCTKENDRNFQENQRTSTISQNEKNVDELLSYYYGEYQSNSKNIFGKIWKWMVAHSGTYLFQNCQGTMPCGPCAGICLRFSKSSDLFQPVDETYQITPEEYQNGERLFQIALFNDTILGFSFTQSDFVYLDSLYVPKNFNIGGSASELFNKDSIIVRRGVYPVSFSHGRNGSTIVKVLSY